VTQRCCLPLFAVQVVVCSEIELSECGFLFMSFFQCGMSMFRRANFGWLALIIVLLGLSAVDAGAQSVSVATYRYDNSRTGKNQHEVNLTAAVVNQSSFGKLFSQAVDGQVYAEPLYLPNIVIPKQGQHNVVYVATEHDSVYAFDADNSMGKNAAPLWHVSFINPANGITTVPSSDLSTVLIVPEIGITGTPVIDSGAGTLYVSAATKENGVYVQRLHALDVTTGAEKFGGPVVIAATVSGGGVGSSGGVVSFDPFRSNQRPGLLLSNGVVYIAWASHGLENEYPYHGWVIGYNENTLAQVAAYCATPNGNQGGIWQSGGGLSADSLGSLFFLTGNGTFDANNGGSDYGTSFVRLSTTQGLTLADYFTPYNQAQLSASDTDIGSGGALLLPYQTGVAHPYLAVGAGKNGVIYMVDRTKMGHFNSSGNSQIVQSIVNAFNGHGLYATPAYWQGQLYFWADQDVLRIFAMNNGLITTTPIAMSTFTMNSGATPVVSSNGGANGIVWAIQSDQFATAGPAVLHALDANTAVELYNSSQAGNRDTAGPAVKFTVPTVINGKVYVGTANQLDVYGVMSGAPEDGVARAELVHRR